MSLDDWRSKVLKDVQYLCKLAAYAIAWREGGQLKESSVQAEVTDRLKQGATALSLARRVMMSGSWIEDFRDLSAVRAPSGEGIASWKGATLLAKTASSVIDDVATSKKIGLIPAHRLPRNFDTIVDTLWTLSVVMHLLYIAVRIRRLNPASPTFDFQRKTLAINFAKFTCDLGQALPAAAHWSSPPLFDTLCGLTSGLLSTYKIWLESQK